jgi:hypothetical protein
MIIIDISEYLLNAILGLIIIHYVVFLLNKFKKFIKNDKNVY